MPASSFFVIFLGSSRKYASVSLSAGGGAHVDACLMGEGLY